MGSPPHTRGESNLQSTLNIETGITPAYAGRILFLSKPLIYKWDHPRIRGENPDPFPALCTVLGSPPHTRGESFLRSLSLLCFGITPAYAGRISGHFLSKILVRDHPRIRGENKIKSTATVKAAGSPPHTRGE